ncbi:hypothetical protein PC110_g18712 [Phytophthora cactorum]|uniref:Transcription activator GCR1-like domain-containing protein n=2 Tax=Phytophthora cactorum TaxID=29920 RepID=A0A329RKV8_9STRA|nr:hypothetical protein PC110_g18712 [Phytophthora cactorum]
MEKCYLKSLPREAEEDTVDEGVISYRMSRSIVSVRELWNEWEHGPSGGRPVKELEEQHGARWYSSVSVYITYPPVVVYPFVFVYVAYPPVLVYIVYPLISTVTVYVAYTPVLVYFVYPFTSSVSFA